MTVFRNDKTTEQTAGEYGEEGYVYQAMANLGDYDGNHPIFGLWIVNHEACGLGIREDKNLITGNTSRFVPHYFK
ncbi:MAG: glutathionylspermidine synthase [Verrucomicrobiales bacterium]|nr:glutathionylspermidine synthase [Verrucomicrobiales bacterium]